MSIRCYLNRPWALLKANLFPAALYHGFRLPRCSELGCHISCDFRALLCFIGRKDPTLPEDQVPQEAGQFSYIHTIPTAGQRLLLAINSLLQQRGKYRNPLHTHWFFEGVLVPDSPPSPSNYIDLNFLNDCLFSVFDELHCAFIVVNCLLISGKRLHFPHCWDCVKRTELYSLWSFTSQ